MSQTKSLVIIHAAAEEKAANTFHLFLISVVPFGSSLQLVPRS